MTGIIIVRTKPSKIGCIYGIILNIPEAKVKSSETCQIFSRCIYGMNVKILGHIVL